MVCIKKLLSMIGTFLCSIILVIALFANLFPEVSSNIFPYHMYTILSNSMEPILPVDSLVIVKDLDGREPKPEEIITFQGKRFGQSIVLTHYFAKTEVQEGTAYYRTHAYGIQDFDLYETTYQDIKGAYVTHIPYVGKFVLYMGSPFGIAMMMVSLCMTLFYHYCNEHFNLDEEIELPLRQYKRKHKENECLSIRNIQIIEKEDMLWIRGELWNETTISLHRVKARITFRNDQDQVVASKVFHLVKHQTLAMNQSSIWKVNLKKQEHMDHVLVEILRAKKYVGRHKGH